MVIRFPLAVSALLAAALLTALPATAQNQPATDAPQPEGRVLQLTPEKFDAFVSAAASVRRLSVVWKERINAASSRAEAQKMADTASHELTQAIIDTPGISTREYAAIARAAQRNEQLAHQIEDRLREAEKHGG